MNDEPVQGYWAQVPVEAGRLRLFAKATGGVADGQAPPTLGFCLISDDDRFSKFLHGLDLDLARTMHAEQSFIYHRPIPEGATVTVSLNLHEKYSKKDGALLFTILGGDIRDADGTLLVEQLITLVTLRRVEGDHHD